MAGYRVTTPPPPPVAPPYAATPSTTTSRGTLETGLFISVVLLLSLTLVMVSLRQRRRREQTVRSFPDDAASPVSPPPPPQSTEAWPPIPSPASLGAAPPSAPSSTSIENGTVEQQRLTAIRALPVISWSPGCGHGDGECVLCIEAYSEGERLRRLPCNHVFHVECIDQWLGHGMDVCR